MSKEKVETDTCREKIMDRIKKAPLEEKTKIVELIMTTEVNGFYINLTKYLKSVGLSSSCYYNMVRRVANNDPKFYSWYCMKKNENREIFVESTKNNLKYMNGLIQNGISLNDGTIREFDSIDCHYFLNNYFQGCGRRTINPILTTIEAENRTNVNISFLQLREMLGQTYADNVVSVDNYYSLSPKQIREDTSYGLTAEEKEILINYFNLYDIPYLLSTYHAAVQRLRAMRNSKEDQFTIKYKTKSK